MNVSGMGFERMVSSYGLGVAVVANAGSLDEEFWRRLDFRQWHEIYLAIGKKAAGLSALETRAVVSLAGLAHSFAEWLVVYDLARPRTEEWAAVLARLAWRNLEQHAKTFDQWLDIYYRASDASRLETRSLHKLSVLRAGVERLCDLQGHTPPKTRLMRVLRHRLGRRSASP